MSGNNLGGAGITAGNFPACSTVAPAFTLVIAGLDRAIHHSVKTLLPMDARVKPAHDEWWSRFGMRLSLRGEGRHNPGDSHNCREDYLIKNTFRYIDFIPAQCDIARTWSRQGKSRERHEAGIGGGGRGMRNEGCQTYTPLRQPKPKRSRRTSRASLGVLGGISYRRCQPPRDVEASAAVVRRPSREQGSLKG
jgi:hypothetical protein